MIHQLIYTEYNSDYSETLYSYGVFDSLEKANEAKNHYITEFTGNLYGIEKEREIAKLNQELKIVSFELNNMEITKL